MYYDSIKRRHIKSYQIISNKDTSYKMISHHFKSYQIQLYYANYITYIVRKIHIGSSGQCKLYSWYGRAGFVFTWHDVTWYDEISYDLIWYDLIWFDVSLFDLIWFELIWFEVSSLDWIIIQLFYSYSDNTLIIIIIIMLPTIVRRRTYVRVIRLVC